VTDFGIDLSHHNSVDDWAAVRGNDITFVSVKLTESTGFVDQGAAGHVDGARGAAIRAGGYHFARSTSVAAQVAHFADRIRALGLDAPDAVAPMLDMEADELRGTANAFIPAFIAGLRAQTAARRVFVYANLDWFRHVLRPEEWLDDDVLLWIARYNGDPGHPGFAHPHLALHQHSEHGHVPGIPDTVDRDATVAPFTLADLLVGRLVVS
jgi:GH25 family lysozyme M1 (1,4-beta-N-acetylmuramidase)